MDTRLIGIILLIVGTTIGGGMLALPMATAEPGFIHSTLILLGCWFVMTSGAFLILEVNLWLPKNSNMISMARATLGRGAQAVAWITYLLLLYSLLSAYIAGGGDFLKNLFNMIHIELSAWMTSLIFTFILGFVVYLGIRSVDLVNRSLMVVKLGSLFLLLVFIFSSVDLSKLIDGKFKYTATSVTVSLTSFGFATIVPSLRSYFRDDIKKLRLAILLGSLIPLICYIAWNFTIMGVIPRAGDNGLIAMSNSGRSTSDFVNTLSALLNSNSITYVARIFTSICLATSFLGVALSLSHFLADGFNLKNGGKNDVIIYGATFLPPLIIVLAYPGAFIAALSYAGIYCVILLIALPALMAWSGRYRKLISANYQVFGGKSLLILLIGVSVFIIGQSVVGIFK